MVKVTKRISYHPPVPQFSTEREREREREGEREQFFETASIKPVVVPIPPFGLMLMQFKKPVRPPA